MKQEFKGSEMLSPVPAVMVSLGEGDEANIITIAWTGIINSNPPMTYISVQPKRCSHDIIEQSGEFVINLVPADLAKAMDFCGVRSGRDVDKFEAQGLTREAADTVSAPLIAESPVNIECRVKDIIRRPSHDMFMADIVNVRVDESVITGEGRVAMERLGLVSLIHGSYYAAPGARIGRMGFSVMKPSTKKKISAQQRAKHYVRKQGREGFDKA